MMSQDKRTGFSADRPIMGLSPETVDFNFLYSDDMDSFKKTEYLGNDSPCVALKLSFTTSNADTNIKIHLPYMNATSFDGDAIQKVRIEFGTLIGLEEDKEAFVLLKELIEFLRPVLPHIIVDHNLYETDEKKMTAKAVTEFILKKLDVTGSLYKKVSSNL
ncbi:MAG: hypothetical protein WC159_05285 [Sphaerochaetaceae bacterium]